MITKDGREDQRKNGPFNVDRAPTGQFVRKGQIDDPIDEYSDSKTKQTQEDAGTQRSGRRNTG